MKSLRFKLLLLVAILATAFFSFGNAQACSSVIHYASTISTDHIGMAMAAVVIAPLSTYVKDNCTITPAELADLALKYGKIKILSVVIEAPFYDFIYKGDLYNEKGDVVKKSTLINKDGNFDYKSDLYNKDKELIPSDELYQLVDAGEFYSYACKRPDQGTIRMMMDFAKKGKTEEYIECFIKNIVVAGDVEKLKTDGLVYLGLSSEVDNFLKPYESFLAKA